LINRARTTFVREARQVPVSALELASEAPDEAGPPDIHALHEDSDIVENPNEVLLRKELADELEAAMADLPERQRRVVVLRDALGWTPEDVCSELSLNETNQRVLLHRARARLRASLEHHRAA
jgi:RNA polymerase sigma-70 factor, ECF subfamily